VTIALDCGADVLQVRVTDEGARDASDDAAGHAQPLAGPVSGGSAAPGRGIEGMRERCELLGGELTAEPRPRGGFEVRARLPLTSAAMVRR